MTLLFLPIKKYLNIQTIIKKLTNVSAFGVRYNDNLSILKIMDLSNWIQVFFKQMMIILKNTSNQIIKYSFI